ncbi:MAG: T9SS type A sorting domain-containing protein [Bacteroidales bacterium]
MKKITIILTVLIAMTITSNAQWQQTNCPYTGRINCFSISGINIFAGTQNDGIYLSTDDGANWTLVNTGLTNNCVRALAISGTNIFAATAGSGVFLSTDNGSNWATLNNGLTNLDVRAFLANSPYLNAGTNGGGDFGSSDNGANWSSVNTGLTDLHVTALGMVGYTAFAGTPSGVFILNYPTWSAVNNGLTNLDVYTLATSGTTLFAGTQGGGIFKTSDNGANWFTANTGLTFSYVTSFAVSGTNIFAGTNGGGVFLSTNSGANWTAINTGLTTLDIYSLAISGTYIYAGTDASGVWKRPLSEVTGINEIIDNNNISVYPNPFCTQTTLQTDKIFKDATLTIYNSFGQQVKQIKNISGQTITFHRDNLPSGLYFIQLTQDSKVITSDKLVITD